jgi:hypothetical protein
VANQATFDFRERHADFFAGQKLFKRQFQIGPLRLRLSKPNACAKRELGIYTTGIANSSLAIQHKHFRRPCGAACIGELLAQVL